MARSTSQNQSQLAGSQRRSSTQRRDLTPERPFVPSTDSRDELARTASHHNGRRQKRPVSELEDDISEPEEEEEDEQSPSISPIKTKKSSTQPVKKAARSSSTKSVSQPLRKASNPPYMKPTATARQPKGVNPPHTRPATAATQAPRAMSTNGKASAGSTGGKSWAGNTNGKDSAGGPNGKASAGGTSGKASARDTSGKASARDTSGKASARDTSGKASARDTSGKASARDTSGKQVGVDFVTGERSRSNSSTTLMPGSNSQSQLNSQTQSDSHSQTNPYSQVHAHRITAESSTPKKPSTKSRAKTEAEAYNELNILSRRYYLAFLSHNYVDEPLRTVFPDMKSGHDIYKNARRRVQRSFKTWKGEMLKWSLAWVQRWMQSSPSLERREMLEGLTTFAEIKAEIRKEYDPKWLESVFRFGIEAVDFNDITPDGLRFLKFAFLQLVTHSRMTELQIANPADVALIKYTRTHLLDMVDALHLKEGFGNQTVNNYPERSIPRALQYKKRPKVDLNIDPDADFSGDEVDDGEDANDEEESSDVGITTWIDGGAEDTHCDEDDDDDAGCGNSG